MPPPLRRRDRELRGRRRRRPDLRPNPTSVTPSVGEDLPSAPNTPRPPRVPNAPAAKKAPRKAKMKAATKPGARKPTPAQQPAQRRPGRIRRGISKILRRTGQALQGKKKNQ